MTDPEVEIFWPSSLPTDPATDAQGLLHEAGIHSTCMLRPTRRGAADVVLVLVTTAVLDPFLRTLFQGLAEEAHRGLRMFVDRLLARPSRNQQTPEELVIQVSEGGRISFTTGLPEQAYQQAVDLDAREGRWAWDAQRVMWVPV
ncbi:hypothetical protein AB0E85_12445 [Streptomyces sp. NPDC029044]|uniref:hypothetical protein n=1 Tax=Streptomyces sp. NPDC029044 TaxID=3157198 RepID=UPI00340623A0